MKPTFEPQVLFQLGFFVLALVFVIHAVIVAYHLLSFGANRKTALLGIAIYLCGVAFLLFALSVILIGI